MYGQSCDCNTEYQWLKKTFEENDAGFAHSVSAKGIQAYQIHNKLIEEQLKTISEKPACTALLNSWLSFFRKGHYAIIPMDVPDSSNQNEAATNSEEPARPWEKINIDHTEFTKYLESKSHQDYEGLWISDPYTIGIKKTDTCYTGFIVASGNNNWSKGDVKLKIFKEGEKEHGIYFLGDKSATHFNNIEMYDDNNLQLGRFIFRRLNPKTISTPEIAQFSKIMGSTDPYIETIDASTILLRIPSFETSMKKMIDSVIIHNKQLITSTEYLIIEIRNNGGGSDNSYAEVLPLLYTNPIRTINTEFRSTKLNNQRMLDFINDPKYGFDEEDKKWAQKSYEQLEKHLGEFVNLDTSMVDIKKLDTTYNYPRQVGIVINGGNGSTAEQFILAAKQSKKVKLFGTTTFGALDISNLYNVFSPTKEYQLFYALSRSLRIPDFVIDDRGLQPDYFIDSTIKPYQWIDYVKNVLKN